MTRWIIDSPTRLVFDGVVALRVRVIAGSVAVLAGADQPCLDVTDVTGQPLLVTHEAGILTITYPDLSWDGLLGWLRPQRHSASLTMTLQADCPAQVGLVSATATVSGLSGTTSLKSVSGDMALDAVTGTVDANTMSGSLEAQELDGSLTYHSVSGDLTLAGGRVERLDARTVSGRVTADIELAPAADVRVGTVSGEVAIRLPADADTRLELRSTSGQVLAEFGELAKPAGPSPRALSGSLRGGSARLSVSSMSGDITILRRGGRATSGQPAEPGRPGTAQPGDPAPPENTAEQAAATRAGGPSGEGEAG